MVPDATHIRALVEHLLDLVRIDVVSIDNVLYVALVPFKVRL
jgi:hypothetical protein